jgi:hypothetical protein
MFRIPHCLDNRLTDGGKVVSPTHRPLLYSQETLFLCFYAYTNKQTLWPLVRKRTIPTERPPLVDEIWCQLLWTEGCRMVSAANPPRSLISVFYTGFCAYIKRNRDLMYFSGSREHLSVGTVYFES